MTEGVNISEYRGVLIRWYTQRGSASAVDDFMARMLLTSFMAEA